MCNGVVFTYGILRRFLAINRLVLNNRSATRRPPEEQARRQEHGGTGKRLHPHL